MLVDEKFCLIAEKFGSLVSEGLILKKEYRNLNSEEVITSIYEEIYSDFLLGMCFESKEEERDIKLFSERILKNSYFENGDN